ncbi:hypothetical protein PSECIP111854_00191 [Pseudoalteromonas sp. CIP111854]|uniref:Sulphotransferase Stf0 domain-containing protein n=1 Tax=Pseudoalteromonas holothuriae TaxID=2963714 RepID=A0A9W4QQU9_9GAMM|nr:sulfotransferase [Pseudoalteromonas sp. CIP111854]CAH9049549.1 hypothetical protein PSECIP111854_00191 [Pseudoalteromonas sp. CIP111854]
MCSDNPARFVILAAPRSGSNMLASMLHSHPDILCHHEIYNPNGLFYALPLRGSHFRLADSLEHRDKQPLECLKRLWQSSLEHKAVGFKMTHRQNERVFEQVLSDKRVKKILLVRNNQLKVHVSKLIAQQSGVWEEYSALPPATRCQVKVELEHLESDITFNHAYYQHIRSILSASGQTWCEAEYEALKTASQQMAILQFLAMRELPLMAQSRKQTPKDLREVVTNYQELLHQSTPSIQAQLTSIDS